MFDAVQTAGSIFGECLVEGFRDRPGQRNDAFVRLYPYVIILEISHKNIRRFRGPLNPVIRLLCDQRHAKKNKAYGGGQYSYAAHGFHGINPDFSSVLI
jgi:hypothetical protein